MKALKYATSLNMTATLQDGDFVKQNATNTNVTLLPPRIHLATPKVPFEIRGRICLERNP
jgi:hypothetical protein